jgi:hypothetical protein
MNTVAPEAETVDSNERAARSGTRAARLALLIRAEYLEMPGLSLTPRQAARLWGEPLPVIEALLTTFATDGFLVRSPRGAYRRAGCTRCS